MPKDIVLNIADPFVSKLKWAAREKEVKIETAEKTHTVCGGKPIEHNKVVTKKFNTVAGFGLLGIVDI